MVSISNKLLLMATVIILGTLNIASPMSGTVGIDETIDGGDLFAVNITEVEYIDTIEGRRPQISLGDNKVSDIWDDLSPYPVSSYGDTGYIKSTYGSSYVYFLISFDTNIGWVGLQWDSDFTGDPEIEDNGVIPMQADDDMWIIGETIYTTILGDGYSAGQGQAPYIIEDLQNDLEWEMIEGSEQNFIEIRRDMDTADEDGRDVVFNQLSNYTLMLASNVHHHPESEVTEFKYIISSLNIEGEQNRPQQFIPADINKFVIENLNNALLLGLIGYSLVIIPTLIYHGKEAK